MGLLVFGMIAIVSSVAWHAILRDYWLAVVVATATAVVVFQVVAYVEVGYLDPFFLIAMATSGAIAAAVAVVTGLPFRCWRTRK